MDPENNIELPESYVHCEIAFGSVPVGKTATRLFPIKNVYKENVHYVVTRSTDTNPIYYVYDVNKYEAIVEPGEEFVLKITYAPNIPGVKNLDYFKVMDSYMNMYKLCFKGDCIGPIVNCSARNLDFHQLPGLSEKKKVIELKNNSKLAAIFQFDVNEDDLDIFKVEPSKGTIEAMKYVYEPILINLLGFHSDDDSLDLANLMFKPYPIPYQESVGFAGYLNDTTTIKTVLPPISLSSNFIDFGRVIEDVNCCNTLTTSLTNHLKDEVVVEWNNGNLFHMQPEKLTIPGGKSALYECKFTPEVPCNLSSTILHGQVTWSHQNQEENMNVPIPVSIRLIGHSFPKNHSWIPEISVNPETVTLPLTLPDYFAQTTFMIRSHGHLPVLFKLLPPKKTNFVMKPMVGLIRDFQLIAVQLQSSGTEGASYIEKWNIELNGQTDRLLPLYVKGQTDLPNIALGRHNTIEFEPMQPGTQDCIYVAMKNTSTCPLIFRFILTNTEENTIVIDPMEGELCPYEEHFLTCCHTADAVQGVKNYEILCHVESAFCNNLRVGLGIQIPITIMTQSVYTELCALPKSYDAGDVESGVVIKTSFYLFNFGESAVNFQLVSSDNNSKNVKLDPEFGKCGPKEKMKVYVEYVITADTGREKTMTISYHSRKSEYSKSYIDCGAVPIFTINYQCQFFALKIDDIIEHNYGYLFSKQDLWKLFKVNKINKALNEIVEGEIRRVYLRAPECNIGKQEFYAVFLVKNITNIEATLNLKRRKVCDCPLKEIKEGRLATPKSSRLLTIYIRYHLQDNNMLSYYMDIGKNKTIELNILITGIPQEKLTLSAYHPKSIFNLGHVYIGLREAPVQAYWIYNNTLDTIPYKLDDLEIVRLCNEEGFEVLKCLNCEGYLKPHSNAPILFKFLPIQLKAYKVVVPLMLGKKVIDFTIEGTGVLANFKYTTSHHAPETAENEDHFLINSILSLSLDHIILEPILARTSTERLCFIKNITETSDVRYSWRPCCINGLVSIQVEPCEGMLKPQESHSLLINIKSTSEPCQICVLLFCEFTNQTESKLYETYLSDKHLKKMRKQQEFTITEDGKEMIEEDITEDNPSVKAPKTLSIALPIDVRVIGILDKDNCLSVDQQFRQKPFLNIDTDIEDFVEQLFRQFKTVPDRPIKIKADVKSDGEQKLECSDVTIDPDMTKNILECLIADTVFSDYFQETVINVKKKPSPIYSQVKMHHPEMRKQETINFLTKLQLADVADICKKAAIDSIQDMFNSTATTQDK